MQMKNALGDDAEVSMDYAVKRVRATVMPIIASNPHRSNAIVLGSGVCTRNSCTWPVSARLPVLVTISKLFGLIEE